MRRSAINDEIEPITSRLEATLEDVRGLVQNADGRLGPLATSLEGTLEDTRNLVQNADERLGPLVESVEATAAEAQSALAQASKTMAMLEGLAPPDSALAYQLTTTLEKLSAAMDSIRSMADSP